MCVTGIDFASLSTIFLLDFGTVPMVLYVLFLFCYLCYCDICQLVYNVYLVVVFRH
jgi:hypothetical protein